MKFTRKFCCYLVGLLLQYSVGGSVYLYGWAGQVTFVPNPVI